MHDGVVGVARHEQHLDRGTEFLQPAGQFRAAEVRHHHVGEDQVDRPALPLAHRQRFGGALRLDHLVAECLQRGGYVFSYFLLVLHHQAKMCR